jgi:SPP1 family predicted phage head-tail adaptor
MIKAGELRAVIEIQSRSNAGDAAGQPLNTWTTWAKQRGRSVGIQGNEAFRAMQFNPEMTHQITIRWIDGITPLSRILATDVMTGKVSILDVISVDYPERATELIKIGCKERISQGGDLDVG